jgi:hypothetical protein
MAQFAVEKVLPAIQKLITQVRFAMSNWTNLLLTLVIATPRQRQKRRIHSRLCNPDVPQTVNQRAMPAKLRKQWIHQTMQEATPRPAHEDETSGTEEEHMDIDRGNSLLLSTSCPSC